MPAVGLQRAMHTAIDGGLGNFPSGLPLPYISPGYHYLNIKKLTNPGPNSQTILERTYDNLMTYLNTKSYDHLLDILGQLGSD